MRITEQQVEKWLREVHQVEARKKRRIRRKPVSVMIDTSARFWNLDIPAGLQPPIGWVK